MARKQTTTGHNAQTRETLAPGSSIAPAAAGATPPKANAPRVVPTDVAQRRFDIVRPMSTADANRLLRTEWLLTNGLGGFAMSTALGVPTRRYHALLVGATQPPVGRVCALHSMVETIVIEPGKQSAEAGAPGSFDLSTFEFAQGPGQPWVQHPRGIDRLRSCQVSPERVTWTYEIEPSLTCPRGVRVTKALQVATEQNACRLSYRVSWLENTASLGARDRQEITSPRVSLIVRPLLALHDFHQLYRREWFGEISQDPAGTSDAGVIIRHRDQSLRLATNDPRATFVDDRQWWNNIAHRAEAERHQDCLRDVYSPGRFEWSVQIPMTGESAGEGELALDVRLGSLIESATPGAEPAINRPNSSPAHAKAAACSLNGATPDDVRVFKDLTNAASAFVVRRHDRDAKLAGTSIIAGYPWFSDWGRDTFISLPGLLLCTGRFDEARQTLETFARARKNGLIPNVFNDQTGEPEYNTVDGPLWFIHAACEYVERSGDARVLDPASGSQIGAACLDVISHYRRGTDHQIAMDPFDKLITAGSESSQLTWMDARRDGVTFTPRYGKPVEVNALWCSGLVRLSRLLGATGTGATGRGAIDPGASANLRDLGQAAGRSFACEFWNEERKCLFDCLLPPSQPGEPWSAGKGRGGDELRPNQLFALSLPHCPLTQDQQRAVLSAVESHLLAPMGVRTLDPRDPRYRPRYEGSLFDRDAAYHQGTAWPFLLGVYAMGVLRASADATGKPTDAACSQVRTSLAPILGEMDALGEFGGCPGFIAEVYDAESPQRPSGCPAQAWSVATILQAWTMMVDR